MISSQFADNPESGCEGRCISRKHVLKYGIGKMGISENMS